MVGYHAHCHIGAAVVAITLAAEGCDARNQGSEHVGVVVRLLALQRHAQALEAHAGVYHLCRQRFKAAVGLAVVLHEHEVPYLDDKGVVLVHERRAVHSLAFRLGTQVDVDFGARTARTRVAHFPEVVVFVAVDDVRFRQVLEPYFGSFVIARQTLLGRAFEHRGIKPCRVEAEHIHKVFPRPVYGLALEIVAEAPVAEHLEHGVVVGVVADLFEVVVFAAHAQTLLAVGDPRRLGGLVAEEDVFELVHPGVGEHQRGVVLDDHRRGGHDTVLFFAEKVEKGLADFVGVHLVLSSLFVFYRFICPVEISTTGTIYKNTIFFDSVVSRGFGRVFRTFRRRSGLHGVAFGKRLSVTWGSFEVDTACCLG